jgi:hypothetical protein
MFQDTKKLDEVLGNTAKEFFSSQLKNEAPAESHKSFVDMVEDRGVEPLTFCMPCKRSPN